jgi:ATP-dependent Clp protease protease subunit
VRDETTEERTLYLDGTIAEDSWFDDDVTPALFKSELFGDDGDITIWLNSPGGDVRSDRALLKAV